MFRKSGSKLFQIFFISLVFCFVNGNLAFSADSPRVYPKKSVILLEDGKPAGEFNQEFSLPNGKILKSNGPSAIKFQSMTLGIADQARFSVTEAGNGYNLELMEGKIFFSISNLDQSVVFITPDETVTFEQLLLNASTQQSMLRGVISVQGNESRIGVIDGGSLRISTLSGTHLIRPDQYVLLSAQNSNVLTGLYAWLESVGVTLGAEGGNTAAAAGAAAIGIGATATGLLVYELFDDDDDDDKAASPVLP